MKRKQATRVILMIAAAAAIAAFTETRAASAHCDTLDGPVVMDAREALSRGDVSLVLKWVQPTDEKEITDVFTRALKVRKQGPEAREMADMHFFETLVRVHRAGEGFPYTGLKPSGADPGTAVRMADKALETGSVEELAGNTALAGCCDVMLSSLAAERLKALRRRARLVNLANYPDFDQAFFENLYLQPLQAP